MVSRASRAGLGDLWEHRLDLRGKEDVPFGGSDVCGGRFGAAGASEIVEGGRR